MRMMSMSSRLMNFFKTSSISVTGVSEKTNKTNLEKTFKSPIFSLTFVHHEKIRVSIFVQFANATQKKSNTGILKNPRIDNVEVNFKTFVSFTSSPMTPISLPRAEEIAIFQLNFRSFKSPDLF